MSAANAHMKRESVTRPEAGFKNRNSVVLRRIHYPFKNMEGKK
jgi:hypothetical protein